MLFEKSEVSLLSDHLWPIFLSEVLFDGSEMIQKCLRWCRLGWVYIYSFVHLMGLFTLKLTSEKFSGIIFIIVSFLCFLFLKLLICKYWMICNRWNAESDLRIQLPFINSNTKENWKNVQSLLTVIIFCFGKCNYFLKNTLWRTVWRFIKKLQIELS